MAALSLSNKETFMAHATRGIAATFVASTLALAACGGGDNVRGGGEAENQGNLTEEPYGRQNGVVDTPTANGSQAANRNEGAVHPAPNNQQ